MSFSLLWMHMICNISIHGGCRYGVNTSLEARHRDDRFATYHYRFILHKIVLMKNVSQKVLKAMRKNSQSASEAVINHKIITSFSSQEKIMTIFDVTLDESQNECRKTTRLAGLGLLISQFLTTANSGLSLWYGGYLFYHHKISYKHLFQTFFVLVATGRVIAEAGSMTLDLSNDIEAIKLMFEILNRESKMNPDDPNGLKPGRIIGDIEVKELEFSYPTRPQ